jgi:hypothetical protein
MPAFDGSYGDLSGMLARLAGEAGQHSLARSAAEPGARASVDQHASEIRDALSRSGQTVSTAALASYAQGFLEVAIARGWCPPQWQQGDPWDDEPTLDWESLRLAAVCRMFIEAQCLCSSRHGVY